MGAVPLAQIPGDQAGFRLPPPLSLSDELRRNRQDPASSKFNSAWSNKGVAWSETEHLAFLKGLQAFGKGQWKQISRYYVPSRTPTQVASHAQKHFLRVSGATKRRSRFSTLEENVQQLSGVTSPQNPYGGRSSGGGANSATTGSCAKLQGTPAATPPPSFPLAREYSSASVLPPNADGLAIGIPWAYRTPMISTPNGKLPLLRVHPGRIDVTKMSTSNGESSKLTHPKLRSPVEPSPKRKMEALKMGDDSKGHLAVLHEISQRLKAESMRTKRRRQDQHHHHSPRSSEFADSGCEEHGDTSAALSALDALAGVAAALADSD